MGWVIADVMFMIHVLNFKKMSKPIKINKILLM